MTRYRIKAPGCDGLSLDAVERNFGPLTEQVGE